MPPSIEVFVQPIRDNLGVRRPMSKEARAIVLSIIIAYGTFAAITWLAMRLAPLLF